MTKIPLKILIVEDMPVDAELMALRLHREGFQLDWQRVENEGEYLEALQAKYDLILSDWSLPQFSGLRALQLMKKQGLEIPFIIISGSIGEEAAVNAMQQGAYDYVLKDRPDRLSQSVRNAMERWQLREEQKKAENLLRLQAAALNAAANAIVIANRDGLIEWINPAFTTLTGYSIHEAIGQKPGMLIGSGVQDQAFYQQMWDTILSGEVWHGEVINRRKNGQAYTEELTITPVCGPNGEIRQFIAIKQDITERKLAEEARNEITERYQASFLGSAAVKLLIDPASGGIVDANLKACEFYGYHLERLQSMTIQEIDTLPAAELSAVMEDAKNRQRNFFLLSHRLVSGEIRDVEVYSSPIKVHHQTLLQFIIHDVTEKKLGNDILKATLRLHEFAPERTVNELIQVSLDEAQKLTRSQIGFFHLLQPDQRTPSLQIWSPPITQYPLKPEPAAQNDHASEAGSDEAGIWADCIRGRCPVIHNNHLAPLPGEQGSIRRDLVVPVFRDDQIVAVLGVGNKSTAYTEQDVSCLQQFASLMWDIIQIKVKDLDLKHSEEQLRSVLEATPEIVFSVNTNKEIEFINRVPAGLEISDALGSNALSYVAPPYQDIARSTIEQVFETGQPGVYRVIARGAYDLPCWYESHVAPMYQGARIKSVIISTIDITERLAMEEKLQQASEDLRTAYDATLQGWSNALEMRERETAGHSQRVVRLTLDLARLLEIPQEKMVHIQRGALLHDIGKMGIPDSILLKPGPLSEEEWIIMRQHPEYAYQLLSKIPYLEPALDIPYGHHERWDGTGYPRRLKGPAIPLAARIFALVDVWDALSYSRPYRPAWSENEVIRYIQEQSGKYFDPQVVEAFLFLKGQ